MKEQWPRGLLLIPNAVTGANIVVGFLSMLAAAGQQFRLAVCLLLVAIVLDIADGRIARAMKATSKFGQEMDSLGDAVSFCVAPAFLAHRAVLQPLEGLGVAAAVAYVVAGVYRLARFNLLSDVHAKARSTLGVPTPLAAAYLMALTLMWEVVPAAVGAVVVVAMALLMVSHLRLPEAHGRNFLSLTMGIGLCNFFAVVIVPSWHTIAWWNFWNVIILLAARGQEEDEVVAARQ